MATTHEDSLERPRAVATQFRSPGFARSGKHRLTCLPNLCEDALGVPGRVLA
jgi:hypothetical protein